MSHQGTRSTSAGPGTGTVSGARRGRVPVRKTPDEKVEHGGGPAPCPEI